jgi:hypothetical protein
MEIFRHISLAIKMRPKIPLRLECLQLISVTAGQNESSEGVAPHHNMVHKAGHTTGGQYIYGVRIINVLCCCLDSFQENCKVVKIF